MPKRIKAGSKVSNVRLAKLYFQQGLTIPMISVKCHIGQRTLYSRAYRLGFKLRSRGEAASLRKRHNLERERAELKKVLLQWSFRPDDCLLSDLEVDGLMDHHDAIAQELKTLVGPKVTQAGPMVNRLP